MGDKPGDGIRSMRTSNAFRVLNFELYAKPNKVIMVLGLIAFTGCCGYVLFMKKKYQSLGYQPVMNPTGEEFYVKKKSKWER